MDNKAIIVGIFLIAIGSFFLGSFSYQSMKYPLTIQTIPTTNLQPSGDVFSKWLRCPECNTLSLYHFKINCLVSQMDIDICPYCHHEIRFIVYYDHEVVVLPNKINTETVTQTITQIKEIPPKWIEIPNKSWVTIGDHYFSYDWKGPMMGEHEVHYCGTGMTWDGFSVGIGTTIYVADWGTYKITDMNEAYVCLTLQK